VASELPDHLAPDSLKILLSANGDSERAHAWETFIAEFTGLILHVAKSVGGDHDAVMDRYLFVVEALRDNEFRRLKQYKDTEGARFTSWLLVVVRRLCLDQYRARYGRVQADTKTAETSHRARRTLSDLVSDELALETLEDSEDAGADFLLRKKDLTRRLELALTALCTEDRLLLRFRFEDDLPVPRIARLVGADSPFVIYRRIDRILRGLRKALEEAGVTESLP
jgi:RNA polymerase sigma factor (sigma-70 family)